MSRSYPPHSPRSANSWRSTPSHGSSDHPSSDYGSRDYGSSGSYGSRYGRTEPTTQLIDDNRYPDTDPAYDDTHAPPYDDPHYDDSEIYEYYEPIDRRWIWVAGVAGAILLIAVICTVVILGGGDSGSVSATVNAPAATTGAPATRAPATSSAQPEPSFSTPRPLPSASLAPETVTTVVPTPTATVEPTPTAAAPVPNSVTYSITGNRSLIDLVTVIYTDQQGALQTDLNVALPWTKTVILDPGVSLSSVTATSITGQLNCSIVDGAGAVIAAQNNNSMITTCTR
jgi:hypothetical protein